MSEQDRPHKGSSSKTGITAERANAQLTAERDRACDLAAALEAELAATRTTRTPSWCLHGDTYRHCPTTPTHPNAK